MTTPDFDRIFAEGGTKDTISDADYDGGWDDLVGALPPTKEEFNALQNESDLKAKYLYDRLSSRKNLLINGDISIWQRGDNFPSGTDRYTADRWHATENVEVDISGNVPAGESFSNSITLTSSSGATPSVRQPIELPDVGAAGVFQIGQTLTLSGWVRATSGTPDISLLTSFRDSVIDSVNNVVDFPSTAIYTVQAANTWEYFEYTFTVSASPNGTNLCYTAVLSTDEADSIVRFTGLQLELGSVATDFEHRLAGEELSLCQRYYQKSFLAGTHQNVANGAGYISYSPTVEMRVEPTVTNLQSSAVTAGGYNAVTVGGLTASPKGSYTRNSASGATFYRGIYVDALEAEL